MVDFWTRTLPCTLVNIEGLNIEIMDILKSWVFTSTINQTDALYKKGRSRLHLLRRLRSFEVGTPLLRTFYNSVVTYAVVCWEAGSSDWDRKRLNNLVRTASSVLDCLLNSVSERRMLAMLTSIMEKSSHPLHQTVDALIRSFIVRLMQLILRLILKGMPLQIFHSHQC